jgi:TP901 family phage tail tape measure protein
MADRLNVSILMKLIDNVTGPARRIGKAVGDSLKQINAAKEKADKTFASAANIRHAAEGVNTFARGARAAIAVPVNTAIEFEVAMSRVSAISNATGDEFNALRNQAIELGAATTFSSSQAAEAQYFLAQNGFKVNEIMSAMPGVLDLAAASGVELGEAADMASNIMGGFGLKADKAGHVADVLAATANMSSVSLKDLAETMSYAGPASTALGVSLETTAAMAGLLGNAGIKGSRAGTALNAALSGLVSQRGMGKKAMEFLNLTTVDKATKQLRPLGDILNEIEEKVQKRGLGSSGRAKIIDAIFGRESAPAVLALMAKGRDEINKFSKTLENSGGTAAQVAKVMQGNTKGSIEQLNGAIEALSINVGTQLLPSLKGLIETAGDIIARIAKWTTEHPKLTKAIAFTTAGVALLTTALAGLLFTIATLVATGGLFTLIGGFGGMAKILFGPVIAATKAATAAIVSMSGWITTTAIPTVVAYTAKLWAMVAPAFAAAAPFLAIALAIGAVTLAIVQLVKHWEELNFMEGLKGISDSFSEDGFLSTAMKMFDPRTLINDMTGSKLGQPSSGGVPAIEALTQKATTLGAPGASSAVPPTGLIEVNVKSDGKATAKIVKSKGIDLDVSSGLSMVAQ